MTRRMLLTLIAILTGLSWQGMGVSARAMPVTSQVSAISALATVQQAKACAVLARPAACRSRIRPNAGTDAPRPKPAPVAPATLIGIDRARE